MSPEKDTPPPLGSLCSVKAKMSKMMVAMLHHRSGRIAVVRSPEFLMKLILL